jgi:hypothetical protein
VVRRLPALLLALVLALPGFAEAEPPLASEDLLARVHPMILKLKRHARRVWSEARPVSVVAWVQQPDVGDGPIVGVEIVFVTHGGIADGRLVARGDELPTVDLARRTEEVPMARRNSWEYGYNVLRKFDWSHLGDEWMDRCEMPRSSHLEPGDSLYLQLERERRIPVLVVRYSQGNEVCRIDDRGNVYVPEENAP